MELQIKNYAMNLSDTKLLKITNYSSSENAEKAEKVHKEKKQFNNDFFNNLLNNGKKKIKKDVYSGSVMVSVSGELTFSNEFVQENDLAYLKGRKLVARARYTKSLEEIGWSRLFVETFDNVSAEIQSWAAGLLEGKLCAKEILDFYENLVGIHSNEASYLKDVFDFYEKVEESIRYRTSKAVLANVSEGKALEYWISVAMVQAQTDGLLAGYNSIMKDKPLNFSQIYFLNADGEVPELLTVFKVKKQNRRFDQFSFREGNVRGSFKKPVKFSEEYLKEYFGSSDPEVVWNKLMMHSHCSALIKMVKNEDGSIKDVLVGHTTWDSYSEMHRIFKVYNFSYTLYGTQKKNSHISFSSYPGTLTSTDDFYVLNKKIVVLETTLEMLDRTLYQTRIPSAQEYVPNYIRISVSNRLATSGKDWTDIFQKNNGGTYNSQWMILDYSKLNSSNMNASPSIFNSLKVNDDETAKDRLSDYMPGFTYDFAFKQKLTNTAEISSGFFYVLEQIPGYIEVKDMTNHLHQKGFWASYNRPYFQRIYKEAGYYDMLRQYSKIYSYDDNPRAQIFNHNINSVQDINGMKAILRTNKNIQNTDYINTISPRYDLAIKPEFRRPAGGIDTKIVSSEFIDRGEILAISGPSTSGNLQPFDWSNWPNEPHYGLPQIWNFGWTKFNDEFVKNE